MGIWTYTLGLDELEPMESKDNDSLLDEFLNVLVVISIAYFIVYARFLYKEGIEKALDEINNQTRFKHVWKL